MAAIVVNNIILRGDTRDLIKVFLSPLDIGAPSYSVLLNTQQKQSTLEISI